MSTIKENEKYSYFLIDFIYFLSVNRQCIFKHLRSNMTRHYFMLNFIDLDCCQNSVVMDGTILVS